MTQDPNYWTDFWGNYGKATAGKDEQTQVLRTLNKQPISKQLWEFTLKGIGEHIAPHSDDMLLELCCGNGLLSRYFAPMVKNVTSVDVSEHLVRIIDRKQYPNITPLVSDIRELDFDDLSFNKVIIYAGIQYLTYAETTVLFEQVYRWLKPRGIFFLGDVPDYFKRWVFFNNPERQAIYFQNLKDGEAIVGTWFEPEFFEKLGTFAGYNNSVLLPQHPDLIYSKFRYDFKLVK